MALYRRNENVFSTMSSLFPQVYYVSSGARQGEWNMAFDRKLVEVFSDGRFQRRFGEGSALWRFYAWHPSALSLGYGQDPESIDRQRCLAMDIDVVRRPTGGRAVLHADEFTYSFLASTRAPDAEVYRVVHDVLLAGLKRLGVNAGFCRTNPDFRRHYRTGQSVSCFTASAKYELQVDGRKIVGSAQRRSGPVILQHGSLLLSERHKLIRELIAISDSDVLAAVTADLDSKTVSVAEIIGYVPDFSDLLDVMTQALDASWLTVARPLDVRDLEALF
ncbi:MAG: ligase [Prosthecochloris sp.]|nr:ligase [Prosthecochloris sp.]